MTRRAHIPDDRDEGSELEEAAQRLVTGPEEEAELIAGFLAREPTVEVAFLDALRRHLRVEIGCHFPRLWPQKEDLQQSAILKLCELRESPGDAKRIRPPLQALAKYLVDAPARVLARVKEHLSLQDWDEPEVRDEEGAARLTHLLEIAASLPRGMATTMMIHANHEMGQGPPLEEVLGIDRRSALRRLARAQAAVLKIARSERTEDDDE